MLSINWRILIQRYRKIILFILEQLAMQHNKSKMGAYYDNQKKQFKSDKSKFLKVSVVLLLSLGMIFSPIVYRLYEKF